jgi:palmitoyltransferase
MEAREKIARERDAQQRREHVAGWGPEPTSPLPVREEGAGRHYVSYPNRSSSKADRILGRTPNNYSDVSMEDLRPRDDPYDTSSDEEETERRKQPVDWPQKLQKVGVVTNVLLGNTITRQKDDVRGWDGHDDEVD